LRLLAREDSEALQPASLAVAVAAWRRRLGGGGGNKRVADGVIKNRPPEEYRREGEEGPFIALKERCFPRMPFSRKYS